MGLGLEHISSCFNSSRSQSGMRPWDPSTFEVGWTGNWNQGKTRPGMSGKLGLLCVFWVKGLFRPPWQEITPEGFELNGSNPAPFAQECALQCHGRAARENSICDTQRASSDSLVTEA